MCTSCCRQDAGISSHCAWGCRRPWVCLRRLFSGQHIRCTRSTKEGKGKNRYRNLRKVQDLHGHESGATDVWCFAGGCVAAPGAGGGQAAVRRHRNLGELLAMSSPKIFILGLEGQAICHRVRNHENLCTRLPLLPALATCHGRLTVMVLHCKEAQRYFLASNV